MAQNQGFLKSEPSFLITLLVTQFENLKATRDFYSFHGHFSFRGGDTETNLGYNSPPSLSPLNGWRI